MIAHGKNIKIFAGNSHPELAEEIANLLGLTLGNSKVSTFSDGEISVDINETVRGADVFIRFIELWYLSKLWYNTRKLAMLWW